jgi:superfamily II DNA or RNA helicase
MQGGGLLREVRTRPIYFLPDDDFNDDVLIDGLRRATAFDCMVGYFDSGAMADLAPGLSSYLARETAPVRLVISPNVSEADFVALRDGTVQPEEILEKRLIEVIGSRSLTENALAYHTLLCLAYLLGTRRVTIKVALVPGGLFHPKVWIFRQGGDLVVAHGSSNMTGAGIRRNVEQIAVNRSWARPPESDVAGELVEFFSAVWSGRATQRFPDVTVVDLPDAVRDELLKLSPRTPPSEDDFQGIRPRLRRGHQSPNENAQAPTKREFGIPEGISLDTGPFKHQGQAIAAWEAADRHGILAMATGSGKTITALAAATRLSQTAGRGLLVVIAAPQLPLVSMWNEEVADFGGHPLSLARGSAASKLKTIEGAIRRLGLGATRVELIVMTHDALVDQRFQAALAKATVPRLLIGDEVHRLGRPEFLQRPPDFFEYRLGLSATPERQYDPDGSAALESYFGPPVFEFGLHQAIGVCLVPFDYYVHVVQLEPDEIAEWRRLTERMVKLLRSSDPDDEDISQAIKLIRIKRRRILEVARRKLPALEQELRDRGQSVKATLVYATDKAPAQLDAVHDILRSCGLTYHQVTQTETSTGRLADKVIAEFAQGLTQVLTAKRVLDEGLNVPGIRCAFVLASTTVERQWVQRLGRVLRLDPTSGKTHAEYHDFVALPAPEDGRDEDARRMIKDEMTRIRFFGQHARNAGGPGAWLATVNQITSDYFDS